MKKFWFIFVVNLVVASAGFLETMRSIHHFMVDSHVQLLTEPPDTHHPEKEYDFIVVGAGSAGCAVAARLSENPDWNVLLIEAGGPEEFYMDIPMMAPNLQMSHADWAYFTEPQEKACLSMFDNKCFFPRGKVVGGSSVLNFMIYSIGNDRDYDRWAEMGCTGWSYGDLIPYFKKMENFLIDEVYDPRFNGRGGPLHIEYAPYHTPISDIVLEAFLEEGYSYGNINDGFNLNVQRMPANLKNGTRHSSSRAYLHPISRRKNLHLKKNSLVTKILIDRTTRAAYGVEFVHLGKKYKVNARKEVIVCAGAINSPQLLMLSGIGPQEELLMHGIKPIQNSLVGYNLQDHIAVGGLIFVVNGSKTVTPMDLLLNHSITTDYLIHHKGPLSVPGGTELIGFTVPNSEGIPEIELLIVSQQIAMNFFLNTPLAYFLEPYLAKATWVCLPMLMKPWSKGRISLKSKNPHHHPAIDPNYYHHQRDLDLIVEGIRKTMELSNSPILQKYGSALVKLPIPGCIRYHHDSDEYFYCLAQHLTATIYHQSGTCKMGALNDPTAVVDPELRVIGIDNLRVIDVSIMPEIPSGHTNGPTIMIAEKGADMIKAFWGFNQSAECANQYYNKHHRCTTKS